MSAALRAPGAEGVLEVIGLVRAGATPEAAWRDALGVATGADGAPVLVGSDVDAAALRAAARLAHRAGASLADVLERVEEYARARRRADAARKAALAGPRASATVLAWLPLVGWVMGFVLEPSSARVLLATPMGWLMLAVGGGLWLTGRRWTTALVHRAEAAGADAASHALPLVLAEAAVSAGLDVRSALDLTGVALANAEGARYITVAARLGAGVPWVTAWGAAWGEKTGVAAGPELAPLERALRPAWLSGASPVPILRAAGQGIVERARDEAEAAAAELGVRAALPLALCFLPAFVCVGVVPLVLALVSGTGFAWEPGA